MSIAANSYFNWLWFYEQDWIQIIIHQSRTRKFCTTEEEASEDGYVSQLAEKYYT